MFNVLADNGWVFIVGWIRVYLLPTADTKLSKYGTRHVSMARHFVIFWANNTH